MAQVIQSPSKEDITRYLVIAENKKKKLEANFRNSFNKWQKKILQDFTKIFYDSYNILGVSTERTDELKALIVSHYIKSANEFIKGLSDDQANSQLISEVNDKINAELGSYIDKYSGIHVNKIIQTTEKYASLSYSSAKEENNTIIEQLLIFSTTFKNKLVGRTKATSYTETTGISNFAIKTASEVTTNAIPAANIEDLKELQRISPNLTFKKVDFKKIEDADELRKIKARLLVPKKEWQNFGDSRVRDSHKDSPIGVGNTVIPENKPFVLDGGKAMYPGDQSLGISLDEVIGCRCIAIYS